MNQLQEIVGNVEELKPALELNICEYIKSSSDTGLNNATILPDPNSCEKTLEGRDSYNIFLVLRDVKDYRSKLLGSLAQNPSSSNLDLEQVDFWINDYRTLYLQKGLNILAR